MSIQSFSRDCASERQPVLLLMSKKEDIARWRLNFNQQEIAVPTTTEEDTPSTSTAWECDFVPDKGGVEAMRGCPPSWDKYAGLLQGKISDDDVARIKREYEQFIEQNQASFIF